MSHHQWMEYILSGYHIIYFLVGQQEDGKKACKQMNQQTILVNKKISMVCLLDFLHSFSPSSYCVNKFFLTNQNGEVARLYKIVRGNLVMFLYLYYCSKSILRTTDRNPISVLMSVCLVYFCQFVWCFLVNLYVKGAFFSYNLFLNSKYMT